MSASFSHSLSLHRRRLSHAITRLIPDRAHDDLRVLPRAEARTDADDSLAYPPLLRWLVAAAVVEWLVGRTLTRGAHFIPKTSPILELYQGLALLGQFAFTLTGVLALVVLGWIAWRTRAEWRGVFSGLIVLLLSVSVLFVFVAPSAWMGAAYHIATLSVLGLIAIRAVQNRRPLVWIAPAAALMIGELYWLSGAAANALQLQTVMPWHSALFNAGELIVVAAAFIFWWCLGRRRASVPMYLAAAMPALVFVAAYWRGPALTGIVAMWSLGISLYLPWALYALAAWLMGATLLAMWRDRDPRVWALLLLIAAGYAPALTTHLFLALIALWLLTRPDAEELHANIG